MTTDSHHEPAATTPPLRVLALEPYFGGSHRAFLEGWQAHSRHEFTLLTLPAHSWKWRMRHAAIDFAREVNDRLAEGERWDAVFASDMLNLAEFRGLAPGVSNLPAVAYFHENQLTYPAPHAGERDYQFTFTNLTTALAADESWFNSDFHRREFFSAIKSLVRRMPGNHAKTAAPEARSKAMVQHPGAALPDAPTERAGGPLRIAWAARWEHDKNPEQFFAAVELLAKRGAAFRLSVLGESFEQSPPVFDEARPRLADRIDHWGFLPSRDAYVQALGQCDVFVSTARHEFFGIAAVEAIAAGCWPLLPNRLAYPEVLGLLDHPQRSCYFYEGGAETLADRLSELADGKQQGRLRLDQTADLRRHVARFDWPRRAADMDDALSRLHVQPTNA